MEEIYTLQNIYALLLSVVIGTGGKIAYDSLTEVISLKKALQAFGLGLFVGFLVDNFLISERWEHYRLIAVPFAAYSATYILRIWHSENKSILIKILDIFLSKLKTNESNNSTNVPSENDSSDIDSDSGTNG